MRCMRGSGEDQGLQGPDTSPRPRPSLGLIRSPKGGFVGAKSVDAVSAVVGGFAGDRIKTVGWAFWDMTVFVLTELDSPR